MNIRTAEGSDAIKLQKLALSLSHFYLVNNTEKLPEWLSKSLDLKEFEHRLKSDDFMNIVCIIKGMIVGCISIKNKNHIFHLFVASEHKKKCG